MIRCQYCEIVAPENDRAHWTMVPKRNDERAVGGTRSLRPMHSLHHGSKSNCRTDWKGKECVVAAIGRVQTMTTIHYYGAKMIETKLIGAGLCAFGLVLLSGCAMQEKKEATAAQAMPVNCATAPGDLRVLNSEKASTAARIGNGVSMVAPIGLVEGLLTRTEKTKYEVTTGEYNKALDTKIAQIKTECPGAQAD